MDKKPFDTTRNPMGGQNRPQQGGQGQNPGQGRNEGQPGRDHSTKHGRSEQGCEPRNPSQK